MRHYSKVPSVLLIEFIRSKLSFSFAPVTGVSASPGYSSVTVTPVQPCSVNNKTSRHVTEERHRSRPRALDRCTAKGALSAVHSDEWPS